MRIPAPQNRTREAVAGRTQIDMARAIVAALGTIETGSAAEALQHLHGAFPQAPVNVGTAALDHMMQRQWQFDS